MGMGWGMVVVVVVVVGMGMGMVTVWAVLVGRRWYVGVVAVRPVHMLLSPR